MTKLTIDAFEAMGLATRALELTGDDTQAAIALLAHALASVTVCSAKPGQLPEVVDASRKLGGDMLADAMLAMDRVVKGELVRGVVAGRA